NGLESRVIAAIDRRPRQIHPMIQRVAVATAACIVLGGFGYVGTREMEAGRLWGWSNSTPATNLRQIGNASLSSSNENKGLFPPSAQPSLTEKGVSYSFTNAY